MNDGGAGNRLAQPIRKRKRYLMGIIAAYLFYTGGWQLNKGAIKNYMQGVKQHQGLLELSFIRFLMPGQ